MLRPVIFRGTMNIRIPRWLVTAWDAFGYWANVPVFTIPKTRPRQWHCASCGTITPDKSWCDCTRYGNPAHQSLTLQGWDVLRIDIIIAVAFVLCVSWYYFTSGWYMALVGGLAFVFFALCALWLF
jgi:hypothetical protein